MTNDEFWGKPPDEEVAVMGCMKVADGNPPVPSRERQCEACKTLVWVSDSTLLEMPDVKLLCMSCVLELLVRQDKPADGEVAPHTRDQLRARGFTDEQIDKARDVFNEAINTVKERIADEPEHEHHEGCTCDWHGNTKCPHCGKEHDAASNPFESGRGPRPGDISICLVCGKCAVFTEEMQLRLPTDAEQKEFDADPEVQTVQMAIMMNDAGTT